MRDMKIKVTVIAGLALLSIQLGALAHPSYVSKIPNGSTLSCANCHVGGDASAGLTAFGDTFALTHTWSAAMAATDSDGDGFSNGQELGDPKGIWTPGAALPIPGANVGNPGDGSDTPTLVPPPINITSPAGGASFTAPYTGPITAGTTLAAAAVSRIQFYAGSTLLGSVSNAPYSMALNLPAGAYSLTARAVDYLGASNTSAAVQITVNPAGNPPTITTQPSDQSITAGGTATFTVAATGSAPLTYQWTFNGANLSGATSPTLTLTNTPLSSAGAYRCGITNSIAGVLSQAAQLAVQRSTPAMNPAVRVTNGVLALAADGFSGHGPIVFLVSSNLTNWIAIGTNAPAIGATVYTNALPANAASLFYRAVEN